MSTHVPAGPAPIRLGIVGCGAIVQAQHLPALRATGAFEITGIADPSFEGAADGAAVWFGIPLDRAGCAHRADPRVRDFLAARHHPDLSALLSAGGLDAVLVATPNHTHAALAAEALAAGCHVLCEKPVAFTVPEHDALIAAARARARVFQVGLVFRYSEVFRYTRGLLDPGRLGPPRLLLIDEFRPFSHSAWRYDRTVSGGMFVEKNCHHFDLFNWMLGDGVRPQRVVAMGGQHVLGAEPREVWCLREKKLLGPSDVIDHAFVLIEYEDGARARLGISFCCPWGREFRVGLMGAAWKVDVYEMERLVYVHDGPETRTQRFPPDPLGSRWQREAGFREEGAVHSGAVRQWEEFARCIREGAEPFCDLAKARESIRLANAADRSLAQGRVVEVDG